MLNKIKTILGFEKPTEKNIQEIPTSVAVTAEPEQNPEDNTLEQIQKYISSKDLNSAKLGISLLNQHKEYLDKVQKYNDNYSMIRMTYDKLNLDPELTEICIKYKIKLHDDFTTKNIFVSGFIQSPLTAYDIP